MLSVKDVRGPRGSAIECAACLDAAVAKRFVPNDRILPGKEMSFLQNNFRVLIGTRTNGLPRIAPSDEFHVSDDFHSRFEFHVALNRQTVATYQGRYCMSNEKLKLID